MTRTKPRYAVYQATDKGEVLYTDKDEEGKPMNEYSAGLRKTYFENSRKGRRDNLKLFVKKLNP